jgi:hypothetical protein
MSKRLILVILFGWLMILAACAVLPETVTPAVQSSPQPNPLTSTPTFGPHPSQALATPDNAPKKLRLTTKEMKEASEDPNYTIDIKFPSLEDANDDLAIDFNEEIKTYIDSIITGFRESLANNPKPDPQLGPSYLEIDFETVRSDASIVSVLLRSEMYTAGAAHPVPLYHAVNYNMDAGQLIELTDLFKQDAPYLEKISSYCIQDLKKQDKFVFEEGAKPKEENFARWNIETNGLRITFDPNQVAPYAAGAPQVLIPYTALKDILSADSPVSFQ